MKNIDNFLETEFETRAASDSSYEYKGYTYEYEIIGPYDDNNTAIRLMSISPKPEKKFTLSAGLLKNHVITEVAKELFKDNTDLLSITLDSRIQKIESKIFYNCKNLKNVYLPTSLSYIGESAFENCYKLSSINLNNTQLNKLETTIFKHCYVLSNVKVPNTITEIGTGSFISAGLTSINIPDNVTKVGQQAFHNCGKLEEVYIGKKVNHIDLSGFNNCTNLKKVRVGDLRSWCKIRFETDTSNPLIYAHPNGLYLNNTKVTGTVDLTPKDGVTVDTIGIRAFYECSAITTISATGLTAIGYQALKDLPDSIYDNNKLVEGIKLLPDTRDVNHGWIMGYNENVPSDIILSGVYGLGPEAFLNCSNLTAIHIPHYLKRIGSNAFHNCENLASVYIENLTSWCETTFDNQDSNPIVVTNLCRVLSVDNLGEPSSTEIIEFKDNYRIPNGVTKIGTFAFTKLPKLTSVTIPSSVTNIEYWGFAGSGLESVTFETPTRLESLAGGVFSTCENLKKIEIPDSVQIIGDRSFQYCKSLSSVKLPNNPDFKIIGEYEFRGCSSLTDIDIPSTVTTIKTTSFVGCKSLSSVNFQNYPNNNLVGINAFAFQGCTNLTGFDFGSSVARINDKAFEGCTSFKSLSIPDNISRIEEAAFANCTSLSSISIGKKLTEINTEVFYGCTALPSVVIPYTVKQIYSRAFRNCTGLSSLTFETTSKKGIVTIGAEAFYNCNNLLSVKIPKTVSNIGISAFANCTSLSNVSFDTTKLKDIDNAVFYNCSNLSSISIPNGITTIKNRSFGNDTALTSVSLPSTLTKAGETSFYNCNNIKRVNIYDFPSWCKIDFSDKESNPLTYCYNLYENNKQINLSTKLTVPNDISKIGSYVFYGCKDMSFVTMEDNASLLSIGSYAFSDCSSITYVRTGNNLNTINNYAFRNCDNLTAMYVGDVGLEIKEGAFFNCPNLTKIQNKPHDIISSNIVYVYPESDGYSKLQEMKCDFPSGIKNNITLNDFTVGCDGTKVFTACQIKYDSLDINKTPSFTYAGANTSITSADSDIEEIYSDNTEYGKLDYIVSTKDIPIEPEDEDSDEDTSYIRSSADRLQNNILFIEQSIPFDSAAARVPNTFKLYNLNSDASYIALYEGLDGFTRTWATDRYKDPKEEKSIELLGHEHKTISALSEKLGKSLLSMDDGTFTNVDPTVIADMAFRVHENYISSKFIQIHTNENSLYNEGTDLAADLKFTIKLSALSSFGIFTNNIDDYNAVLYNKGRGSVFPIYAGPLRNISSESARNYISSQTKQDEYYLSCHTLLAGVELTGTPNIFEFKSGNKYVPAIETNSFFNIKAISVDFIGFDTENVLSLDFTFSKLCADNNYILDANSIFLAIYSKFVGEYEDYHYFLHHPTVWPYDDSSKGGKWPPKPTPEGYPDQKSMNQISALSSIPAINAGSLAFKINEEYDPDYLGSEYPPDLLHSELYRIFAAIGNANITNFENIFALSNTYIFEVEKPKELVSLLTADVKVPIFASLKNQRIVTHESLSGARTYGSELSLLRREDIGSETNIMSAYYIPAALPPPPQEGHVAYRVIEPDLKDFLKIYVNYMKDEITGDITLFFNYNNFFNSPFVYRRDSGAFCTQYKPETYLKLAPGKSGMLTIMTQLQYIDGYGDIRGAKDLPLLAYKIWNVSDDKPKFVIKVKWIIDDATLKATVGEEVGEDLNKFMLTFKSLVYPDENGTKDQLNVDYTTPKQITVRPSVEFTLSSGVPCPVGMVESLSYDLIYDFDDQYVEFIKADKALYSNHDRKIKINTSSMKHELQFSLLQGAPINDVTLEKVVWLDAINPVAILPGGITVSGEDSIGITPGSLTFKFDEPPKQPEQGSNTRLLSKEYESTRAKPFDGYILSEKDMPIRLFGKYKGESNTSQS